MAKRKGRMIKQAALETLVRFGPQLDALQELKHTAGQSFQTSVGAADVSNASTQAAIRKAVKPTAGIYDHAHDGQQALNTSLATGLAGLSGGHTDLIKAAALSEAHMASTHLNEAKAQALQGLTNRGMQAEAARASSVRVAATTLHDDLASIGRSEVSLAGQAGAFKAATLGDLKGKAAERSFTAHQKSLDRQATRANNEADNATSRENTQARVNATKEAARIKAAAKAKKAKAGKLPNGIKRATPGQQGKARDVVDLALAEAKRLKAAGHDHNYIGQTLTTGRSPQTVDDGSGNKLKVPGVSKVGNLYASVALDLLENGRVSARNRRRLNQRGLTVHGMGLKGPLSKSQRKKVLSQAVSGPFW